MTHIHVHNWHDWRNTRQKQKKHSLLSISKTRHLKAEMSNNSAMQVIFDSVGLAEPLIKWWVADSWPLRPPEMCGCGHLASASVRTCIDLHPRPHSRIFWWGSAWQKLRVDLNITKHVVHVAGEVQKCTKIAIHEFGDAWQWRRYTKARQVKWRGCKIHRPGSALPIALLR